MPLSNIAPQLETLIQSELAAGESVAWSGSPSPSRMAKKALPMLLFGVPWTAFSIVWVGMAVKGVWSRGLMLHPGAWLFPLFGLPFVAVGLWMLSAPFWARRKAPLTVYVITDRRAIICETRLFRGVMVQSFQPAQLGGLKRVQQADGSGDLILDRRVSFDSEGGRRTTEIGFFGVPDVKYVEELVRALANGAK